MRTNNVIPLTTFEGNFAQQGWQCPICKRVYSPTTPMCLYCGNHKEVTTTNTKSSEGFLKMINDSTTKTKVDFSSGDFRDNNEQFWEK